MIDLRRRLFPIGFLALTAVSAVAATPARFTGEQSCASSSCHGGGKGKDQFQIFHKKGKDEEGRYLDDPHNRAQEALAKPQSVRLGETLGISDVRKDARCTVCHAPQQSLPPERFAAGVKPADGVSCESCHGAAENWLRFHTRLDITHDQRVGAGLREVKGLYARANVCVGCHVDLDPKLVGHPDLLFELDGQTRDEHPHWKEEKDPWLGPRTWLVGQAATLREVSWMLTQPNGASDDLAARWRGLRWMLKQVPAGTALPADQVTDYRATQTSADRLARNAAKQPWSKETTLASLKKLTGLGGEFRDPAAAAGDLRRRAELLIPAIDRHWQALKASGLASPTLETALKVAADVAKAQNGFKPDRFAAALEQVDVAMELLGK